MLYTTPFFKVYGLSWMLFALRGTAGQCSVGELKEIVPYSAPFGPIAQTGRYCEKAGTLKHVKRYFLHLSAITHQMYQTRKSLVQSC